MTRKLLCSILLLVATLSAFAQQITVQGTVISATDNEPLIGASVIAEGTTLGTATDFDGTFTLTVDKGAKITVSYVGFDAKTLTAEPEMNIILSENSATLEEMVVVG
ncbi:MAG: carboxypeptidase-like regulatory domain-containing protein, partial [Muribaculaceae bacterium]|nr:carboxypeptidase-like regulatory domain-containing protein [Muribaculaceae bacterium]